MRPTNYEVFGMYLTLTDDDPVDAGAYKVTGNPELIKEYRKDMDKILRALLQRIRDRKKTKKGAGWKSTIKVVASCHKVRNGVAEPDRLHVHLLLDGTHGETIAQFIRKYWRKRFKKPIVKYGKYDRDWLSSYMDEQAFITKTANL